MLCYLSVTGLGELFRCSPNACLDNGVCAEGQHGPVCGLCVSGWAKAKAGGGCANCEHAQCSVLGSAHEAAGGSDLGAGGRRSIRHQRRSHAHACCGCGRAPRALVAGSLAALLLRAAGPRSSRAFRTAWVHVSNVACVTVSLSLGLQGSRLSPMELYGDQCDSGGLKLRWARIHRSGSRSSRVAARARGALWWGGGTAWCCTASSEPPIPGLDSPYSSPTGTDFSTGFAGRTTSPTSRSSSASGKSLPPSTATS
eukprot:2554339-Rhodomonas_salina.1